METGTLVSIGEYLSTSYRPDCDYVDGIVEERNVGEKDHSKLQGAVFAHFYSRRKQWHVHAFVEQRVQVSPTRFRIPDVCVVLGEEPLEQIFRRPPFIFIEIQSPEDRLAKIRERMDDYLAFGVPYVWLVDPKTRRAWQYTSDGTREVKELRTENPELVIPLAEFFE